MIKTKKLVLDKKRTPGIFKIKISKEDKVIFNKTNMSKQDVLALYFKNLDENIKNHPEYNDAGQLCELYDKLWSNYNIISIYIDSWGHKFNCFLSNEAKYNYINSKLI